MTDYIQLMDDNQGGGSSEPIREDNREYPKSYSGNHSREGRYGYDQDKHVRSMASKFNKEFKTRRHYDKKHEEYTSDTPHDSIRVEMCEFYPRENAQEHNTHMYEIVYNEPNRPVYRRGLTFRMTIRFKERPFEPERDNIRLVFNFGPNPSVPKETKIYLPLTSSNYRYNDDRVHNWEAHIQRMTDMNMDVEVYIPPDAPVGVWRCWVETCPEGFPYYYRDGSQYHPSSYRRSRRDCSQLRSGPSAYRGEEGSPDKWDWAPFYRDDSSYRRDGSLSRYSFYGYGNRNGGYESKRRGNRSSSKNSFNCRPFYRSNSPMRRRDCSWNSYSNSLDRCGRRDGSLNRRSRNVSSPSQRGCRGRSLNRRYPYSSSRNQYSRRGGSLDRYDPRIAGYNMRSRYGSSYDQYRQRDGSRNSAFLYRDASPFYRDNEYYRDNRSGFRDDIQGGMDRRNNYFDDIYRRRVSRRNSRGCSPYRWDWAPFFRDSSLCYRDDEYYRRNRTSHIRDYGDRQDSNYMTNDRRQERCRNRDLSNGSYYGDRDGYYYNGDQYVRDDGYQRDGYQRNDYNQDGYYYNGGQYGRDDECQRDGYERNTYYRDGYYYNGGQYGGDDEYQRDGYQRNNYYREGYYYNGGQYGADDEYQRDGYQRNNYYRDGYYSNGYNNGDCYDSDLYQRKDFHKNNYYRDGYNYDDYYNGDCYGRGDEYWKYRRDGYWYDGNNYYNDYPYDFNGEVFKCKQDVYILFNPWCRDDPTYLNDEMLRQEYVLNDTGKIWVGSYMQNRGRRWVYGQFDDVVLPAVMYLLEEARMSGSDRANPISVVRAISEMVNSEDSNQRYNDRRRNDQRGNCLMMGRWDGRYDDGVSPYSWTGSVRIMEQYLRTGKPVKYGQCWVYAGVATTICRALGIPCRPVTNFTSAHDTNNTMSVDKYFSVNGDEMKHGPDGDSYDSVWSFHCWNEVWMDRPDLPSGCGGWQAIDCTYQEESDGRTKCGPASLECIRSGEIGFNYDAKYLFTEVNAEINHWQQDEYTDHGFNRMRPGRYCVGREIMTKRPGYDDDECDDDRMDVTCEYKPRAVHYEHDRIMNAFRGMEQQNRTKKYDRYFMDNEDVLFEMEEMPRVYMGQPFMVQMHMMNRSNEPRSIEAMLSCHSMYYNGVKNRRIQQDKAYFELTPNQGETFTLRIMPEDYEEQMVDFCMMKMYAIANVKETRQAWVEEEDFYFEKPRIHMQTCGPQQVGQDFEVNFGFTNPLSIQLTNCRFSFEGPGLQRPRTIHFRDVRPGEMVSHIERFVPKQPGETKIVCTFTSHQLNDVFGSRTIGIRD